jgi:hypothetical protein
MQNELFKNIRALKLMTVTCLSMLALVWSMPSFAQDAEPEQDPTKNFARDLRVENDQMIYTVNARAPHLYMISRDLYGNEKHWSEIAKWNSLKAPYTLAPGQKLILQKPPTNSPAEGNRSLVKSWAGLDKWDVVEGIVASEKGIPTGPRPASTEEAKPVVVASNSETKAELAPIPTHSIESMLPSEDHHRWSFNTSAAVSAFRLESNNDDDNVHNVLFSDADYGVELEAAYHLSEDSKVFLGAAVEKMDIRPSSVESEIEGESQILAKYTAGLETEVTHYVDLAGSFIYEQIPFSEATTVGTNVEAIFIPQISLGARWNIFSRGNFKTLLVTDALLLLPKNHDAFDLKSGDGYTVGFKFSNKMLAKTLTYGIAYRYWEQDTSETKYNQQALYGNIGLLW